MVPATKQICLVDAVIDLNKNIIDSAPGDISVSTLSEDCYFSLKTLLFGSFLKSSDRVLSDTSSESVSKVRMDVEKVNFGYSMKNIRLPSHREYLSQLIHSTETFVRNLRWRSYFLLNPSTSEKKEKFEFRSIRAPPQIKELRKLEDSLYDLVKNIKFRRYTHNASH